MVIVYTLSRGVINDPLYILNSLLFMPFLLGGEMLVSAILVYSLFDEMRQETIYQVHSLPVGRFSLLFFKFLAALTAGIIAVILSVVLWCVFLSKVPQEPEFFDLSRLSILITAIAKFTSITWILGITCATAGAMLSVSRYRLVLGTGVFISLFSIPVWPKHINPPVLWFLSSRRFPFIYLNIIDTRFTLDAGLSAIIYSLIFVLLGILLYERFAEV
ncbi:hypothetical protein ACFL1R_12040 [Candidatus Latescibacterota bacterium]